MTFLKQNWREVIGWIVIGTFVYLYLFQINNLDLLTNRKRAFEFLVVITVIILSWLRINKGNV